MPFSFKELNIPGVFQVETKKFSDARGEFLESYKASEFEAVGITANFKQDNFSKSKRHVLRGMHYQLEPQGQGKFVRVLSGSILDVVVDMRKSSPAFKKWLSVELNSENGLGLYVPVGCAHGFLSLEDNTSVLYKTTQEYAPKLERGLVWNDSEVGIVWPIANPILAERDANFPIFKNVELFD